MNKYDYEYIDVDGKYTNRKTGVLWNKLGIVDSAELALTEHEYTSAAIIDFRLSDFKITDSSSLLAIHKFLFEDVYECAGETRTVNISKNGDQFFNVSSFDSGFSYVNSLINDYCNIRSDDKPSIARKLAEILDNANFLHPFREGNGRTQREFIRILAKEKGFEVDLGISEYVRHEYFEATVDGDVERLARLFEELLRGGAL